MESEIKRMEGKRLEADLRLENEIREIRQTLRSLFPLEPMSRDQVRCADCGHLTDSYATDAQGVKHCLRCRRMAQEAMYG
jgi:ribosomal protein S27E